MKAVILGAGFGTRLQRDLDKNPDGPFRHLQGVPKALLPIGNIPLISHWMNAISHLQEIDTVCVVTNKVNHDQFDAWRKDWPQVELVCDGATSNETRIGAVGAINLAVQHLEADDHILVIAGDTLLYDDFSLGDAIGTFNKLQKTDPEGSIVLYTECTDEDVHLYGILETDEFGRVSGFKEKPQPHETKSRKECPCFYILNQKTLPQIEEFLDERKDGPLKARDATGMFIADLVHKKPVYTYKISGRFDVGHLKAYEECNKNFLSKIS